jgi:hypothetical protein
VVFEIFEPFVQEFGSGVLFAAVPVHSGSGSQQFRFLLFMDYG